MTEVLRPALLDPFPEASGKFSLPCSVSQAGCIPRKVRRSLSPQKLALSQPGRFGEAFGGEAEAFGCIYKYGVLEPSLADLS